MIYKKPTFLERFKRLEESGANGVLEGPQLLIEKLEENEERKSQGGIILADSSHGRSQFDMHECTMAVILQVGEGAYDPTSDTTLTLRRKVGNVIQVSSPGISWETTTPLILEGIPDKLIGRIDDRAIIRSWESMEDYLQDVKLMRGETNEK